MSNKDLTTYVEQVHVFEKFRKATISLVKP